jgi:hypothetical protein
MIYFAIKLNEISSQLIEFSLKSCRFPKNPNFNKVLIFPYLQLFPKSRGLRPLPNIERKTLDA